MYNTKFKVKYNDIEKELLSQEDLVKQYNYSSQDIMDICNKLYRDEFLSVFGLEYFENDKINTMITIVYDKMMTNIEFKQIIDDIIQFCCKDSFLNTTLSLEEEKEIKKQIVVTSLFSQHLFYITHKCICQQIEWGTIDKCLLVELKTHSIDIYKNQFV
jgi:uncharacterized protein YpuA (DUF1002 family)